MARDEMKHLSHRHPLTLVEEEECDRKSEYRCFLRCYGCTERIISGVAYYRCKEDCPFFCLHQSCAHLPMTIEGDYHDDFCRGDLQLMAYLGPNNQMCRGCRQPWYRFSYACSICGYVLDMRCATKEFKSKLPFHEHPVSPWLLPQGAADLSCSVCGFSIGGGFGGVCYRCNICSFIVHPHCTSVPVKFCSSYHPHELQLNYKLPTSEYCRICREVIESSTEWAYSCRGCRYYTHVYDCSGSLISGSEPSYFGHHHPLVFIDGAFDSTSHDSIAVECQGCRQKISCGPYYTCKDCTRYHLHKLCADLPEKIKHQVHPACTLSLLRNPSHVLQLDQRCKACRVKCNGFVYHCSSCDFFIDILCALRSLLWEKEFHRHPLILSPTKASFSCHACDKDSEGVSYQCNTCQFWVHQNCASLPGVKETPFHDHCLNLIYSIPENFSRLEVYCQICREVMKHHNWAYHCSLCRYFTHVHDCSNPFRDGDEVTIEATSKVVHLPLSNELTVENKFTNGKTIKHHRHHMILFADQFELHAINVARAFTNLVRGFVTRPTFHVDGKNYNGSTFSFNNGKLVMEVTGSDLPHYVKHEAHPHVLKSTFLNTFTWCNVCDQSFFGCGFRCTTCAFTVDTYCALLPKTIKYKYDHEHPFSLTYSAIKGVEEYVCEICEEDIIPKCFYHCVDCDHSIHARCIWHAYIEFEHFYRLQLHGCRVNVVPPSKDLPRCIICDERETLGHGFAFLCTDCEFMVHLTCTSEDEVQVSKNDEEHDST